MCKKKGKETELQNQFIFLLASFEQCHANAVIGNLELLKSLCQDSLFTKLEWKNPRNISSNHQQCKANTMHTSSHHVRRSYWFIITSNHFVNMQTTHSMQSVNCFILDKIVI